MAVPRLLAPFFKMQADSLDIAYSEKSKAEKFWLGTKVFLRVGAIYLSQLVSIYVLGVPSNFTDLINVSMLNVLGMNLAEELINPVFAKVEACLRVRVSEYDVASDDESSADESDSEDDFEYDIGGMDPFENTPHLVNNGPRMRRQLYNDQQQYYLITYPRQRFGRAEIDGSEPRALPDNRRAGIKLVSF